MAGQLGNSIAARRDRTIPRLMVASLGEDSVLRGAAALAVRGALSPRSGQMFTNAEIILENKGGRHEPAIVGA
jgi:hypothetical protein